MGKMILISVVSASLAGALMLMSMKRSTTAAERQINQYRAKEQARRAAEAGYARSQRHVWEKWSQGEFEFEDTLTGAYESGTYEAHVVGEDTTTRAEAEVEVVGRFDQTNPGRAHTVDATFSTPTLGAVPKALQYAIMSEGDLQLNGTALIESDSSHVNADVHTNQGLDVDGLPNAVDGFGTYSDSKSFSPIGSESSIFSPNANPEGVSAVQQSGEVEVPSFDPAEHAGDADHSTSTVDWDGTEVVDFSSLGSDVGTEDNPAMWYVDGDLNVSGSVEVQGYGIVVVTGSITVSGGAATSQASSPPGWMGLYADGDVDVSGNTEIHGQLFANGDVSISGTPEIHGSVTSRGQTTVNGTADLNYRKADPALTQPIWGGSEATGLQVDAYSEW